MGQTAPFAVRVRSGRTHPPANGAASCAARSRRTGDPVHNTTPRVRDGHARGKNDGDRAVPLTLKELAERIGAEPVGDAGLVLQSANTLEEAQPGQVSFLANPKYLKQLETTRASAVVVTPGV